MNKKILFQAVIGLLGASALFQSCLSDSDDTTSSLLRPTAIVTVCPSADGSFVMNLDNKTTLKPSNVTTSPFGKKEVRALVNFTDESKTETASLREVKINWIDSIRTKKPVSAATDPDLKLGNDPIEIINDWVTVAEDGYITLRVRTRWGETSTPHVLNLLTDINPENQFEMKLCHNANGDIHGPMGDALIAFNLNGLPGFNDRVKIKLNWTSFNGPKSAEFDLPMRGCTLPDNDASAKTLCSRNVK